MLFGKRAEERRAILRGVTMLAGAFGLSLLTGNAGAQNMMTQKGKAQGNVPLLDSPDTWPHALSVMMRSLSDYGSVTRYDLKLAEPTRVATAAGRVFWVRVDTAVDKAAVFGEPMYRFALYNSDDSQLLDYMYISGTNTATFIKQDLQFNVAPLNT